MNLNDDWENGKLPFGRYWCKVVDSPYIEQVMSDCMSEEDIIEILDKVPSYEEYQRLKEIEAHTWDYDLQAQRISELLEENKDLKHFDGKNVCLENEALGIKVMKLEEDVVKGDRIIGELLNEGNSAKTENRQLRQLLKECDNELKILRMLSLPIASAEALHECDDLLTRINAVLGESEE
ncbi:MAG: hypothetical protein NC124_02540 [Clostridium sp.]|nr:hypothetical protein [Clostridium sp.]